MAGSADIAKQCLHPLASVQIGRRMDLIPSDQIVGGRVVLRPAHFHWVVCGVCEETLARTTDDALDFLAGNVRRLAKLVEGAGA